MTYNGQDLANDVLHDAVEGTSILDELERIRQLEIQLHVEPTHENRLQDLLEDALSRPPVPQTALPDKRSSQANEADSFDTGPVVRLLGAAQTALLRHPAAATFVFQALVDEGRRVAATAEGQQRATALATDAVMADIRRLWEATSLNVLSQNDETTGSSGIPAGWIELVIDAAAANATDSIVDQLRPDGRS